MPSIHFNGKRKTRLSPLYTFPSWHEQNSFLIVPREEKLRLVRTFFTHNNISLLAIFKICGHDAIGIKSRKNRALLDFLHGRKHLCFSYEIKIFALYYNLRYHPDILTNIKCRAVDVHLKKLFNENGFSKKGICPNLDRSGKECTCEEKPSFVLAPNQNGHEDVQELIPVRTGRKPEKLYEQLLYMMSNPQKVFDLDNLSINSTNGSAIEIKETKVKTDSTIKYPKDGTYRPFSPPPQEPKHPINLSLHIDISSNYQIKNVHKFTCKVPGSGEPVEYYFGDLNSTEPRWYGTGLLKAIQKH